MNLQFYFYELHIIMRILENYWDQCASCTSTIILPLFHSKNRKNEIFLEDLELLTACYGSEVKVKSHILTLTFSRHHTNFFNFFCFSKLFKRNFTKFKGLLPFFKLGSLRTENTHKMAFLASINLPQDLH